MKKHLKRIQIVLLICVIMVFAGCYQKPHTQKEVEKYVAQNVPEEAELVSHYERKSNNGTEYVYVFKSKTRDLKMSLKPDSEKVSTKLYLKDESDAKGFIFYILFISRYERKNRNVLH